MSEVKTRSELIAAIDKGRKERLTQTMKALDDIGSDLEKFSDERDRLGDYNADAGAIRTLARSVTAIYRTTAVIVEEMIREL